MHRRYLLIPIVMLGATALYSNRLSAYLKQASANVRAFDLPTAGMYDALVATVLEGFYARVAGELAAAHPGGKLLEVGSGPGRLAVRLAEGPGLVSRRESGSRSATSVLCRSPIRSSTGW